MKDGWTHGACWGEPDGLYSDPVDCSRYIHCFNGYTYRRLCPYGTAWNPETARCDFPYNLPFICNIVDVYAQDYGIGGDVIKVSRDHDDAARGAYAGYDVSDQVMQVANEFPKQILQYVEQEFIGESKAKPQRGKSEQEIKQNEVEQEEPLRDAPQDDYVYGFPTDDGNDIDVVNYYDSERDTGINKKHKSMSDEEHPDLPGDPIGRYLSRDMLDSTQHSGAVTTGGNIMYDEMNSQVIQLEDIVNNGRSRKERNFRRKNSKLGGPSSFLKRKNNNREMRDRNVSRKRREEEGSIGSFQDGFLPERAEYLSAEGDDVVLNDMVTT